MGKDADAQTAAALQHVAGIVTPNCLNRDKCWFCYGCKLPKHLDHCVPVGHYCGTYVWVPAEGRDELTKLTLLIQDIAFYEPPAPGAMAAADGGIPFRQQSVYPYTSLGLNQLLRNAAPPLPSPGR